MSYERRSQQGMPNRTWPHRAVPAKLRIFVNVSQLSAYTAQRPREKAQGFKISSVDADKARIIAKRRRLCGVRQTAHYKRTDTPLLREAKSAAPRRPAAAHLTRLGSLRRPSPAPGGGLLFAPNRALKALLKSPPRHPAKLRRGRFALENAAVLSA